jgi:hypothetical protein
VRGTDDDTGLVARIVIAHLIETADLVEDA